MLRESRLEGGRSTVRRPKSYGLLTRVAIPLLILAKCADAGTTWVGLTAVPGVVERNPIAAAVIAKLGPTPGLAVLSLAAVLGTLLAGEILRYRVGRLRDRGRLAAAGWTRLAPAAVYLGVAAAWSTVAVRNLFVLVTAAP